MRVRWCAVVMGVSLLGAATSVRAEDWQAVETPVEEMSASAVLEQASASKAVLSDFGVTRDDLERASRLFARAAELEPDEGRWVMGRAYVAFHRDDVARCYELAKEARRLSPDDAELQYRYGNACFAWLPRAGFFSKGSVASRGRDAYRRAIELDPRHVDAHFAMARFYVEAPGLFGGNDGKAEELASELEDRLGAPWLARRVRAYMAAEDGEWGAFATHMESARTSAPSGEDAARVLTEWATHLLEQADRPGEAIEVAARVAPEHAYLSGRAAQIRARALESLGRVDEAVTAAASAVEAFADDPDGWLLLGRLRAEVGDRAGAKAAYRHVVRGFPDDARREEASARLEELGG